MGSSTGFWFLSILLACFCSLASFAADASGTGLETSVAVDTVGSFGENGTTGVSNRLDLREAEFMFLAPIDHLFNGVAGFAAHYESGALLAEAHGAYIESTKLIPRSRFKIGQFFLGFGRINNVHRHDWPFITVPKVNAEFFDKEGVIDTGIEYGYLLPTAIYLDLTLGITNGWNFGHSHTEGSQPSMPTHYARLATFFNLPGKGGIQTAFNYVGRTPKSSTANTFLGLDIVAKWRENQIVNFLLQSEIWVRLRQANDTFGLYIFPQAYLGSNLYLGARLDYYSVVSLPTKNFEWAVVPTLTWQPSEFARFRLATTFGGTYAEPSTTDKVFSVQLQSTFIIGTHPAHEF